MNDLEQRTIGAIVAEDFRAAAVFEKHGIDFCCGGKKPVDEACATKGIRVDDLLAEIAAATREHDDTLPRFTSWNVDRLIDHILSRHHTYVKDSIPRILMHVNKVASVHGANHPETLAVRDIFQKTANDLLMHMHKEEQILFPMIRGMAAARSKGPGPIGSARGPISVMLAEHETAGEELAMIKQLTNGYAPPPDACGTYQVSYRELEDFEKDLHQHIFLENEILFPKAVEME